MADKGATAPAPGNAGIHHLLLMASASDLEAGLGRVVDDGHRYIAGHFVVRRGSDLSAWHHISECSVASADAARPS